MGDSAKLPGSGPGAYRYVQHRRYLDELLRLLDVRGNVTFCGPRLGFGPGLRLGGPGIPAPSGVSPTWRRSLHP